MILISIPLLNDPWLHKLIQIINPIIKPVIIPVVPELFAQENECFAAVKEKIKRDGGIQIFGWQIWKSNVLIEAEFHSVWKSLSAEIKDVTPKKIPISETLSIPINNIVFLPDLKIKYSGVQIDNIRLNITKNLLVDDFIEVSKARFRLLNKGDRAFKYAVVLNNNDNQKLSKLDILILKLGIMAQEGKNYDSDCFCGSCKKYKNCCHEMIGNLVSVI